MKTWQATTHTGTHVRPSSNLLRSPRGCAKRRHAHGEMERLAKMIEEWLAQELDEDKGRRKTEQTETPDAPKG